jgi:predicted nucleic acid-binding protein
MHAVLDTSAVIYLLERKHPGVVAELRKCDEAPIISAVTLAELAVGWATLPNDSPRRRTFRAACRLRVSNIVFDSLEREPTGLFSSFGLCRAAGIKGNDAWIAATAHNSAGILITFDATLADRYAAIGDAVMLGAE